MAIRPIFKPLLSRSPYYESVNIEFQWFSGFSRVQSMRTIESLHEAAKRQGIPSVLEISTKSPSKLGASLSAFELSLTTPQGATMSVECAYQGSKVFEGVGPFHELYEVSSREAKRDPRLRNSGEVTAFEFFEEKFPIEPQTAFYNWLYLTALTQMDSDLEKELGAFEAFSDIAFNPKRSINCQARAVAVYVALTQSVPAQVHRLDDWNSYMEIVMGKKINPPTEAAMRQLELPLDGIRDAPPPSPPSSKTEP